MQARLGAPPAVPLAAASGAAAVGLTYAVPLTFRTDAKLCFRAPPGYALAARVGGGLHGTRVPERR